MACERSAQPHHRAAILGRAPDLGQHIWVARATWLLEAKETLVIGLRGDSAFEQMPMIPLDMHASQASLE